MSVDHKTILNSLSCGQLDTFFLGSSGQGGFGMGSKLDSDMGFVGGLT